VAFGRYSHDPSEWKAWRSGMVRVVGIDHISVRVGDFEKSKAFYDKLFPFLGFKVLDEYPDSKGWTNGSTRYWIGQADAEGKRRQYRIGDIGLHHYAFELRSRADVDALQAFVKELGATIVDPAAEYYDDYYAVFFLDPDGIKLEGMKYGEEHAKAARARARKRAAAKTKTAKTKTAKAKTAKAKTAKAKTGKSGAGKKRG
jgi:catechol 2,3-dioxygenase-like lactoylglutathione lyase family enzyme